MRVHVRSLEGWFSQTLPRAPIGAISFLRLDGDLFRSTIDGLNHLYYRVSRGGLIYVDDYMAAGCRSAVHAFRQRHNITTEMRPVWEQRVLVDNGAGAGEGNASNRTVLPIYEAVWWQKR